MEEKRQKWWCNGPQMWEDEEGESSLSEWEDIVSLAEIEKHGPVCSMGSLKCDKTSCWDFQVEIENIVLELQRK